jgi:hypothetical protein
MSECTGNELHEHFSLDTHTYIEHEHLHDRQKEDYNNLHHHPPVDHHYCAEHELSHNERNTGRRLEVNAI